MNYWKKNKKYLLAVLFVALSFHFYFWYLIPGVKRGYLLYLDVLLGAALFLFVGIDFLGDRKREKRKEELLAEERVICEELSAYENCDIAAHDTQILKGQLQQQYEANCDLQDYIAKWCHEIKIPLSASLLMAEGMEHTKVRQTLLLQLEKMNQQVASVLLGCRVESNLFDMNVQPTKLSDVVRTSIQNNQFFLIRNHFEIKVEVEELTVYSDKSWLVYVMDQLMNNAVKYAKDVPRIHIWSEHSKQGIVLFVEDNGEGIKEIDKKRIFEKGFTGSNHHNGRYKSTGMGLYMAAKIMEKLGHGISVMSVYGEYTRFRLEFVDNREFFYRA